MAEFPLISVIIPVYRAEKWLDACVQSVVSQQWPNLEVILVDDGSPDGSGALCDAWAERDPRVRVIHKENGGLSSARNAGIACALQEGVHNAYLAFLDADDYWEPSKLKKQLKLIQEKDTVICSTARELMDPDGSLTGYILPVKTEYTYSEIRLQNQINCSSVLMKTEVAREFPMHHDDGHEDYLMWLEVLRKYDRNVQQPSLSRMSQILAL